MKLSHLTKKRPLAVLALIASVALSQAFPPAPYYTIYGIVRDQVGQTIKADGAVLLLLKGGKEVGRTAIQAGTRLDQSYELSVRLDANRSGTALYTEKAVASQGVYSLAVEMNGQRFYPIEVSGSLITGKGGERVRLDLNLGVDTDKDGLPDVWEEWQLFQSGETLDGAGKWPIDLINKDGDFDGDGQSNFMEYLAGTFAGDASESFGLTIKEKLASKVRFEFYAITGKTYAIERSDDFKTWARVPFSVESDGAGAASFSAAKVGVCSAFAAAGPDSKTFYRLTVR